MCMHPTASPLGQPRNLPAAGPEQSPTTQRTGSGERLSCTLQLSLQGNSLSLPLNRKGIRKATGSTA